MNEITKDHELEIGKSKGIYSIIYLQSSKLVTSQKDFRVC